MTPKKLGVKYKLLRFNKKYLNKLLFLQFELVKF